jgi:uncharacterized membrane protein YczE
MGQRLMSLYVGLVLFGVSMALFVDAGLGLMPWDVFHQGIARHTGLSLGTVVIIVGALVLLLWIPLRERPGFGTVSNVIVIGVALDAADRLLPSPSAPVSKVALMLAGVLLNAFATLLYLHARMGAGPRDGLLTGLLRITGRPPAVIKTGIEVCVVAVGWALGGSVGIGTVVFALGVGSVIQLMGRVLPGLALRAEHREVRPDRLAEPVAGCGVAS